MDFLVLSRREVESGNFIPQGVKHVIVSIGNPQYDVLEIENNYSQTRAMPILKTHANIPPNPDCKGIIRLHFWDATGNEAHNMFAAPYSRDELFNENMAHKILKFIRKHKDSVSLIVCHCEAGISRSAATAAALSKCFGQSDMQFYKGRFHPNPLVYRTILTVANELNIVEEFAVTA